MSEIESRERYFYRSSPPVRPDTRFRCPNTIPTGIKVHAKTISLLFDDQAVHLRAERIHLKNIASTTVMIRIDEDFKVVVEILAHIAPEFAGDDSRRGGVETMNP